MQLERRFTPFNLLLLSINGMIGSAWLFAPLYAAKIAGSAAIIAWIIGGLITILIALTFAELSTLFPTAGGSTRIPQRSHGELTSFTISWVSWLSCVTMPPIEVQAVLQYASVYFPSLTHSVNGAPVLTGIGLAWATVIMIALCIINIASFKGLVFFNQILFVFKVGVLLLTALMLMRTSFHPGNFSDMVVGLSSTHWQAILTAVATGGVVFAFTGFKHGVELAGEAKNSSVAIPLAIVGSVVCCLLCYLALQIAFIGAIQPSELSQGWSALTFPGDVGPFVGIAGVLGLAWLVKLLYLDAVVSPLGAGLVYVTSTSRLVYAMSHSGYLMPLFTRLNSKNFPMWAIVFNFVIGMLLFLPLPGWQNMVSFLVSAVVVSYAMGPIALLSLRREMPNERRVFRLPLANISCLLAFYCCNLISYWTGWETLSKLAIAMCIGFAIFAFAYGRGKISQSNLGLKSAFWIIPYLTGLVIISYLGSFGGKHLIPFGWDFAVIGIFSIVMLNLAVALRSNQSVEQQMARQRLLELMRKGVSLGEKPFKREDLYER